MTKEFDAYCEMQQEYRSFVKLNYTPLYTHLYTLNTDIFVPSFLQAIELNTREALQQILHEEYPGIYSFDVLKAEFCSQLIEEIMWFEAWCKKQQVTINRPNSMNNYGAVLDDFGFDSFLNRLMTEYISPLSTLLFNDTGGGSLDEHHGFVVEYKMGKDESLGFHSDDSDVTFNVCLGREFTNGTIYFNGLLCRMCQQILYSSSALTQEQVEIEHKIGRALLHRGLHRHGANDITSGERYNLILWCRSNQYRTQNNSGECPDWCDNKRL
ncbi:permease of the major facilitator superfamily [Candidatus Scalindua japonica]|uniref:Permease of the major facilitator superfamily n=1 Tax=Candidatus Scalindua japonica TaxID=1284222 RepID=A0A286U1G3_9BACT|nr:hypothetical protein [Candidatus Scalindua japonica]GAX61988.1 permease of the major facilitator superfamily [Candidatus Scalindua japonica]